MARSTCRSPPSQGVPGAGTEARQPWQWGEGEGGPEMSSEVTLSPGWAQDPPELPTEAVIKTLLKTKPCGGPTIYWHPGTPSPGPALCHHPGPSPGTCALIIHRGQLKGQLTPRDGRGVRGSVQAAQPGEWPAGSAPAPGRGTALPDEETSPRPERGQAWGLQYTGLSRS